MTAFFFDQSSTLRVEKEPGSGPPAREVPGLYLFARGNTGRGLPIDTAVAPGQIDEGGKTPSPASAFRGH